uniref:Uncharacterized protein n=1 Tax=Rhizophora mucronata TaxID=61149 RepID=A0A2P2JQU5_RHIMU
MHFLYELMTEVHLFIVLTEQWYTPTPRGSFSDHWAFCEPI